MLPPFPGEALAPHGPLPAGLRPRVGWAPPIRAGGFASPAVGVWGSRCWIQLVVVVMVVGYGEPQLRPVRLLVSPAASSRPKVEVAAGGPQTTPHGEQSPHLEQLPRALRWLVVRALALTRRLAQTGVFWRTGWAELGSAATKRGLCHGQHPLSQLCFGPRPLMLRGRFPASSGRPCLPPLGGSFCRRRRRLPG